MSDMQATLSEYDFILVLDKSGSMGEEDMPGKRSRWAAMQETVEQFTREICKIDDDGIGLVLFSGNSIVARDNCDVAAVKDIFGQNRPGGSTPLADALREAFKLAGKSAKKDFILVMTDGIPDDKAAAANVIKKQANAQETDDALTILFVQVGYDAGAAAYLQSLDDSIKGAKFDIVDTKTMAQAEQYASIGELIVAAIND